MALVLSAPKTVLLAVQLATVADIDSLALLAARHATVLRKELLLRILLTYLPETVKSAQYVDFVKAIAENHSDEEEDREIDITAVENLTEEEAARRVRKLRLLPLAKPGLSVDDSDDAISLFLLHRAYRVDEEAGLLDELPALLMPFVAHAPCIQALMVSSILPLLRRNYEYYPHDPLPHTLWDFQHLPDRLAVDCLLSQTGVRREDNALIGRDLKGLIGPWLYSEKRWLSRKGRASSDPESGVGENDSLCPGWERVLEWLTTQAVKSWRVSANAIQQWDGPGDVDLGGCGTMWLNDEEEDHLEKSYARAALASVYSIPEASLEALEAAHDTVAKMAELLDIDPSSSLQSVASMLPPFFGDIDSSLLSSRNATYLRNDLLLYSNVLTTPNEAAIKLLQALVLSAFLMTRAGTPTSVRRAGELTLLRDEREQKAEAIKLVHSVSMNGPRTDDKFWIRFRNEVLWLRDWGAEDLNATSTQPTQGPFGQLSKDFLEVEILKALLANAQYPLARSLYEDTSEPPLSQKTLQDTIISAAMSAYDNASNPNRTRGGVKKCDDIVQAFPKTIDNASPVKTRTRALIKATHALSEYRLVLKQGEPFTPVVLRVHKDPVSIIGKVLEQNPKSYTRMSELLDLGNNMVRAGLTCKDKAKSTSDPEVLTAQLSLAERRITAMCIDAALTEDDFETAYSYVVNRLSAPGQSGQSPTDSRPINDEYSWKAALQAGTYRRTSRTLRPTHLGTASGNPEIRHLEQRIECLATALRVAPAATLQQILNAFRRAEEELDSAIKAEAEQEDAWDDAADTIQGIPGGFASPVPVRSTHQSVTAAARSAAAGSSTASRHQAEEPPMSLFDLSRASILSAQRNITALSSLQRTGLGRGSVSAETSSLSEMSEDGQPKRARKRDQLREAAMGTLVSGVGWLINAPASETAHDDDE